MMNKRTLAATVAGTALTAALLLTACGTGQPQNAAPGDGSASSAAASSAVVQDEAPSMPIAFVGMTEDGTFSVQYAENEMAKGGKTAVLLVENLVEGGSERYTGTVSEGDDGSVTISGTDGEPIRIVLGETDENGVIHVEVGKYGAATVTASDPATVSEIAKAAVN